MKNQDTIKIVEVSLSNLEHEGIYCIKDKKSEGFKQKLEWYKREFNKGLRIFIAKNEEDKQIGFIEVIPAEYAWRPIHAPGYLFIQCLVIFSKEFRNQSIASELINRVEAYAKSLKLNGLAVLCSNGPWMANSKVFLKNGFSFIQQLERFELNAKSLSGENNQLNILDFISKQSNYSGWHLLYADQCPWHDKSARDLSDFANEMGIDLLVEKINYVKAQNGPSGFGTFSLLHNGKLLADHYISKTRFQSIVKNELKHQ